MKLFFTGLCTACKSNRCCEHKPKILKTDKVTGLEMEAVCTCVKHVKNSNQEEAIEVREQ